MLFHSRERLQSIVISTSVCVCVCLSVSLYVCEDISGTTIAISTKCFVHVAYGRGLVISGRLTKSQWEGAILLQTCLTSLTPPIIANWTGPCSGVHTSGADA